MEKSPVIKASAVRKTISGPEGELTILDGVELTVNPGESVAIVGASGSGKTTLLGLLAGLDVATSGQIALAGTSIERMDEEQRARLRAEHVGFVFQSFNLLPALTAEENVSLPLELKGSVDQGEVRAILDSVGLTPRRRHYPRQMSGGEQQRVALARAFVTRPRILFADEPTGNLDQTTGQHIIDLLFSMNREHGTTLVLVTHDLMLAKRCTRRFLLDAGRLTEVVE